MKYKSNYKLRNTLWKAISDNVNKYNIPVDELEPIYKYLLETVIISSSKYEKLIPKWKIDEINTAIYNDRHIVFLVHKYNQPYETRMSLSKALKRWGAKDLDFLSNVVERFKTISPYVRYDVVTGQDIIKYYAKSSDKSGDKVFSCMKDNPNDSLSFYIDNDVKLVVGLDEDDNLVARCLLWDVEGGVYLDRRYESKGDIYKFISERYNVVGVYPTDKHLLHNRQVKVKEYEDYLICPYLDSANFIVKNEDKYYLVVGNYHDSTYQAYNAQNTNGLAKKAFRCPNCNSIVEDKEDMVYYDFVNDYICLSCEQDVVYDEYTGELRWRQDYCEYDKQS